jgi:hypothetical protein
MVFCVFSLMKAHRQKMAPEHDKDENENAHSAADADKR